MNSAIELVKQMHALGAELSNRDGRLEVVGPRSVLTKEVRAELLRHKAEILKLEIWNFSKITIGSSEWILGKCLSANKQTLWPSSKKQVPDSDDDWLDESGRRKSS